MALTVAQMVARLTADTSGFYRGMAVANAAMIRSGSIISRVTAGAGLAVTAMGFIAIRSAASYQQAMNMVQATTQSTNKEMELLSEKAIQLGKDFKLPNVSAKDAADAMVELGKAGFSTNQILSATRGVLQLGLAANMSFSDSAIIVARSLKAFNLEGQKATMVANLLSAGANRSTADITDLAYGLQNASGQVASARMPIQSLIVALSELTDKGLSGEYAGTALKTMLIRLQGPTDKAAKLMNKLHIDVYDAGGTMKSMPAIIQEFASALGPLTDKARNQALITIFGARANQAMYKLLQGGVPLWNKYKDSIVGTKSAQEITEARTKGLSGALGALGSAVETLAIQLGTPLLGPLESAVRGIANFIAAIDPDRIIKFVTAIKDAVVWFKNLTTSTLVGRAALIGFAAALGAFLIIGGIVSLVSALTAAIAGLTAVMLANPIVLVAAALVGLGVALVYAYQHSERFREIVNATWSWMQQNIPPILDQIVATVTSAWNSILAITQAIWPGVRNTVMNIYNQIANFIRTYSDTIRAIVETAWNVIRTAVETQLKVMLASIRAIMAILRGDWGEAWNQIKIIAVTLVTGMWNQIKNLFSGAINILRALAGDIWSAIVQQFRAGVNQLKNTAQTALNLLYGALRTAAGFVLGLGKAVGTAVVNGVKAGLENLVGTLLRKVQDFLSTMISWAGWAAGLAASIGHAIVDGIKNGISSAWGSLKGWFEGQISDLLHPDIPGFSPPEHAAAEAIGKPIAYGIKRGFLLGVTDLPSTISDKIREALEAGKKVIESYQSKYQSAFGTLISDALSAFDAVTEAHKTKSEKLLDALLKKEAADEIKKRLKDASDAVAAAQDAIMDAQRDATEKMAKEQQDYADKVAKIHEDLAAKLAEIAKQEAEGGLSPEEAAQKRAEATAEAAAKEEQATKDTLEKRMELERENAERMQDLQKSLEDAKQAEKDLKAEIALQKRKDQLEKNIEEERKEYEASRNLQKRHLEQQLNALMEALAKHPEEYKKIHRKILALLDSYGVNYKQSGAALGHAFAIGLRESMAEILAAAQEIADRVAAILKTKSPTKEGPMSDLDTWWSGFAPSLLKGLDTNLINDTVTKAAPTAGAVPTPAPSVGGTVIYMPITVEKAIGSDLDQAGRELAEPVRREMLAVLQRNGVSA